MPIYKENKEEKLEREELARAEEEGMVPKISGSERKEKGLVHREHKEHTHESREEEKD